MRCIKLFEEFGNDFINLSNILTKYDIPFHLWGKGKSKTLENLLDEIEKKECYLEEKNGLLIRYIEFVGIKIYFRNNKGETWRLFEDRQEFKDGRIRRRNMPNSVSEKMIAGEDALLAGLRGIKEELGIEVNENQLIKRQDLFYDGGSLSYPGLETKYKGHKFICYLNESQFNEEGYVENQKDKSTFFVWKKL